MENVMNYGFVELSANEMTTVTGGGDGFFGFIGDIYDSWNQMWKDLGKNIYHAIND